MACRTDLVNLAPGSKFFSNVNKIETIFFVWSLPHTNAIRKFWGKKVKHFGLRKINKSKTKCHPNFIFFTDEPPLLRSAWKLSSMLATPTWSSTIFFQNLKHLIFFSGYCSEPKRQPRVKRLQHHHNRCTDSYCSSLPTSSSWSGRLHQAESWTQITGPLQLSPQIHLCFFLTSSCARSLFIFPHRFLSVRFVNETLSISQFFLYNTINLCDIYITLPQLFYDILCGHINVLVWRSVHFLPTCSCERVVVVCPVFCNVPSICHGFEAILSLPGTRTGKTYCFLLLVFTAIIAHPPRNLESTLLDTHIPNEESIKFFL